ncbi:MAG: BBP7 family outer membrane beta-barrel protein [Planctomycetia bacterium]|nr:BBP7 family outer membrane beta-barrel protein [Planctomycetia bacterium]
MRFVVRLAIAIATLISSAILCSGQPPAIGSGIPQLAPSASLPTGLITHPAAGAPKSTQGTWVSDSEELATPRALPPVDSAGVMVDDSDADEAWCDPDGQNGTAGGGCGLHRRPYFHDLWTEVHSHRRIFVQTDYLSWWTKGNPLPPLATTSTPGTLQPEAGVLPVNANTSILFGNQNVDNRQRNGGRINVGYWLIDGEFLGVEGQYFALEQANTTFNAISNDGNGNPILARPFINVNPIFPNPREDAQLIGFPGFTEPGISGNLTGGIKIRTTSNVQSADALLRQLIWIDFTANRRLEVIGGYRFFRSDDSVTVDDNFTIPAGTITAPIDFVSRDQWIARNQFHGGEIGLKGQSYHGRFMLEGLAKVAFGNNTQRVSINGFTTETTLGQSVTTAGGLLTQPTNIGTYRRDVFAILPEANVNLRYDLTCNLRLTVGYTFLYINRVQRSGDAIDRTLNPTQIGGTLVGPARPAFTFHDTTFNAHGLNAGIEYRW